jgi:hypothetical protein
MTMVSAGADGDAPGPAEAGGRDEVVPGEAVPGSDADGAVDGAGVTSGALLSADGRGVAGVEGTGPSPPEEAQPARTRPIARISGGRRKERDRMVGIGRLQVTGVCPQRGHLR